MIRKTFALLTALLLVTSLPLAVFADTWYLEDGDITVSANESGQTVAQGETSKTDNNPTITQRNNSKTTDNTITIKTEDNATANVTIEDVNIKADKPGIDVRNSSSLNLTVKGENKIENTSEGDMSTAGIHVSTGSLTITGATEQDKLDVTADSAAAIGSNYNKEMRGSISIKDKANVTATTTGNYAGAGIGSGMNGEMSGEINIENNATVNATSVGVGSGAAIGTGCYGEMSGSISIKDEANVTATTTGGPGSGAGIGSGMNGEMSGEINIENNATVNATSSAFDSGAGIGSGAGDGTKMSGTISISTKATIDANSKGDNSGDDIGAGARGTNTGTIRYFDPNPAPTQPEPAEPKVESAAIYQVVNEDGVSMGYTSAVKDGALTITVKGDYARLTGSVASLATLASWGYSAITLVTDNATSTFALADLQAKGPGTYALTHSGQEVTLTLNGEALAGILK